MAISGNLRGIGQIGGIRANVGDGNSRTHRKKLVQGKQGGRRMRKQMMSFLDCPRSRTAIMGMRLTRGNVESCPTSLDHQHRGYVNHSAMFGKQWEI